MRLLHGVLASVCVSFGCGGASGTVLGDGGGIDGGDASPTDAAPPNDATQNSDATTKSDSGTTKDAGLPCPDESGSYSILLSGLVCGDSTITVTKCIQQSQCSI